MKVGFTGTRSGLTAAQCAALAGLLTALDPDEFHHGAAPGADTEAVLLLVKHHPRPFGDYSIVARPGYSAADGAAETSVPAMLASLDVPPETHLARNRAIVNVTDVLVACPPCRPLPEQGGTAYTVAYARKRRKPVKVVWPDGTVEDLPEVPSADPRK